MQPTIFDPRNTIKNILLLLVQEIDDTSVSNNKKIHSIRVASKKIRSILYLIKSFLKDKELLENKKIFYKELSKNLSQDRERKVMYDTLHRVIKKCKLPFNDFKDVENALNIENKTIDTIDIDKNIQLCKKHILSELNSIDKQEMKTCKKRNIKKGFKRTYRKAYDLLHIALLTKNTEEIHRFRKYAKYHMYQIQLLLDHIDYPTKKSKYLDKMTSILGRSHDLSFLEDYINNNKNFKNAGLLLYCIEKRQKELIKKAIKLANKIFKNRDQDFKLFANRFCSIHAC